MKDHTQFQASTQFALALVGEPFTRKTSVAFQFPKPLIFDCDRKLSSVVDYYPNARPFWFVEPDLDSAGNELPPGAKWPQLMLSIVQHSKETAPAVWVFDSMTRIAEYLCDYIINQGGPTKDLVVGGEKVMTQQMWYPFKELLQRFIVKVRSFNKPCIFIFHEKTDKDEVTGAFIKQPAISGQLAGTIAKLFTDVWRTQIKNVNIDATHPGGIAYVLRTEPTSMMQQLGHTRPLPVEFEFSWDVIAKAYPHLATL